MNVLVATASKHGSTAEMGRFIGDRLAAAGLRADVRPVAEVEQPQDYDAVVLGSAVYVGRWLPEAVEFVDRHSQALRERPIWLFSSGPIGDPPMPKGEPEGLSQVAPKIEPRGHRKFTGRLARNELGLGEKVIMSVVRAPEGDYRDWQELAAWAEEIARELHT